MVCRSKRLKVVRVPNCFRITANLTLAQRWRTPECVVHIVPRSAPCTIVCPVIHRRVTVLAAVDELTADGCVVKRHYVTVLDQRRQASTHCKEDDSHKENMNAITHNDTAASTMSTGRSCSASWRNRKGNASHYRQKTFDTRSAV